MDGRTVRQYSHFMWNLTQERNFTLVLSYSYEFIFAYLSNISPHCSEINDTHFCKSQNLLTFDEISKSYQIPGILRLTYLWRMLPPFTLENTMKCSLWNGNIDQKWVTAHNTNLWARCRMYFDIYFVDSFSTILSYFTFCSIFESGYSPNPSHY